MGVFQKRQAEKLALAAAKNTDAPISDSDIHKKLMAEMALHLQDLKQVKSHQTRADKKRGFIKHYDSYVDGVLAADTDGQDSLLMHIFVWAVDIAEYETALLMLDYIIRHDLAMPAGFERDAASFAAEQLSQSALQATKSAAKSAANIPPFSTIETLIELTENCDMHDQIRAKLLYAAAETLFASSDHEAADKILGFYNAALDLNPKLGIKQKIKALEKTINEQNT